MKTVQPLLLLAVAIISMIATLSLSSNAELSVQDLLSQEAAPLRQLAVPQFKGVAAKRLPAARDLKYYSEVAERKLQTAAPDGVTVEGGTAVPPVSSGITGTTIAVIVLGIVVGVIVLAGGAVFISSVFFKTAAAAGSAASTAALQQSIAAAQNAQVTNQQSPPAPPLLTRLV